MLKRNQAWYLKHKDPETRVGKYFLQQITRETTLLQQLNTLFHGYDNEKQAGLKLGAANSIGRCISRITDLLGVKARSIDDLAVLEALGKMREDMAGWEKEQDEIRQKQKVHPL